MEKARTFIRDAKQEEVDALGSDSDDEVSRSRSRADKSNTLDVNVSKLWKGKYDEVDEWSDDSS